ncbi:hypothetical protein RchiOBHm_Chr1g0374651 [Rosa chinensis]|uniref:Uncharacterized protein n=1 Tax=Rosa chinensis TaxID=74649 RepID=A0A2P6SMC5_ROSCH|nr:hypothetical protein RchiOBHm_Chr1g0374651 [Rosa chinensis]
MSNLRLVLHKSHPSPFMSMNLSLTKWSLFQEKKCISSILSKNPLCKLKMMIVMLMYKKLRLVMKVSMQVG